MAVGSDHSVTAAAELIRERTGVDHDIAIVLGSGWAAGAASLGTVVAQIQASDLPGFTDSQVPGHSGFLTSIRLPGAAGHALVLGARRHYYQGRDAMAVAHPIRVAAACGARRLVLTNACGSICPQWPVGQVVAISDHINLTGASPLDGSQFIDLTDAYSPALRQLVQQAVGPLPEGVYAQFPGPQYETPAEIRMARAIGADLVGMSTALETIAARAAGLEVLGLSLVTNPAAGLGTLDHLDVLDVGERAGDRLAVLIQRVVAALTPVGRS